MISAWILELPGTWYQVTINTLRTQLQ